MVENINFLFHSLIYKFKYYNNELKNLRYNNLSVLPDAKTTQPRRRKTAFMFPTDNENLSTP